MKITLNLSIASLIILLGVSCAKQSSPMGGPKDEEPPKLISSTPEHEATNIKPREIQVLFDEFVKIENPTKQIIITPRIKTEEVEFTAIKNRINIKLNQELEDSTTYVFNFQKSVQDITEGNPAGNLKLVFSTGTEIDSLKVSGRVRYIFPKKQKDIQNVLVGLYHISDTSDIFSNPPYYIAQADSLGNFEITNIKAGEYTAYAWHDDNNSLKAEYRSEAYGFLPDPILVDKLITNVLFNLYRADLSELKVNRSSPTGSNYDVILNKPPAEFQISHPEKNKNLFYRIKDNNIRIYHTELRDDSTSVRLTVKDSVGFSIDTTIFAKFETSERSLEKLEITANSGKGFVNRLQSRLSFNKPVTHINYDSLSIRYDTASRIPINPSHISLVDSADFTKFLIEVEIPDSLDFNVFTVFAADSTFMDVENQWNTTKLEANYNKIEEETLSDELSGKVETNELPIIIQLLNKNDEVIKESYLTETNEFKLVNIEAGDYKLRAIIDRNQNRRWDPGNLFEKTQPEPVYYFYDDENETDQFILRGGWTLDSIVIPAKADSGILQDQE